MTTIDATKNLSAQERLKQELDHDMEFQSTMIKTKDYTFRFSYGEMNEKNIEQLRILNKNIFPVTYLDSFYENVLKWGTKFNYYGTAVL